MMNQPPTAPPQVTVLLFKDNLTARTFQIPLKWISRLGLLIGLLVFLTLAASILAGKYFWVSLKADPARVEDLEHEIIQLKTTLNELEKKPAAGALTSNPSTSPTEPAAASAQSDQLAQANENFLWSSLFPTGIQMSPPDPSTLPFTASVPKASWSGTSLRIRFSLQYIKGDEGNQQGSIVMIARGGNSILAYPPGVFSPPGSSSLISPDKGESFSVSRFREVRADFASVRNIDSNLKDVEIFIFSKENQLLMRKKVEITLPVPATKPEGSSVIPVSETAPPPAPMGAQ